MLKKTENTTLW